MAGQRRPGLWPALLGCFVCQMGLGFGYVFGVVLKHIVAEFDWSRTAFAAGSAPLLLSMALSAPLVGVALERFGARVVLSAATLLLGVSLELFARIESLWHFYAVCALFGLALTGLGDVAVGAVASRWVQGRRGLTLGFVFVGSNLGGALVPLVAGAVASADSWRSALHVLAVGSVVWVLPFALFAVREPPALVAETRGDAAPTGAGEPSLDLAEAVRTRSFWILALTLLAFYLYYLAVNQHLVAFLSDAGFSDARAAASLSFAVALGIASKLAIGWLADRIPVKRALQLNFAVLTAGSFLLLVVPFSGTLVVFLVAHGATTAAENVLLPLAIGESFGVAHIARIYGVLMIALFPGGVLGPVLAGVAFDSLGSYRPAFMGFAVLNLLALLGLAGLRNERERTSGTAERPGED